MQIKASHPAKKISFCLFNVMPESYDMPVRIFNKHLSHKPFFILRWRNNFCPTRFNNIEIFIYIINIYGDPCPRISLVVQTKKYSYTIFRYAAECGGIIPLPFFIKGELFNIILDASCNIT